MTDRLAYLDALGIPAYVPRETAEPATAPATAPAMEPTMEPGHAAPASASEPRVSPITAEAEAPNRNTGTARKTDARAGVVLGPGAGSCLFLAGPEGDESSPLASDLARILSAAPVWARLAEGGEGQRLELAIAERLLTHVIVFGEAAARLVFGAAIPESCGPARVTVVDDFARLATDAGARKSCWLALKAAGVVTSR